MVPPELLFGIRNILLFQIILILAVPQHAIAVGRELVKLWKSIKTPLLAPKDIRKKRSKFWEIDMTKFEP